MIDGFWIGSAEWEAEASLRRVEAALELIRRFAPLHYRRVKKSLSRIWVQLVPHGSGCYLHSLNACVLDERVIAAETTTLEWIASAIVHEATHARLEKLGVRYEEAVRLRIEAICIRREIDFARRLPDADALLEDLHWSLEHRNDEAARYTDRNMSKAMDQGNAEALRYLGTPEPVIALIFKVRHLVSGIRRFTRRMAGASSE